MTFEAELAEILGWAKTTSPAESNQHVLTDAERIAYALCDTFGPTWCQRLALELLEVAGELLATRRQVPDV